MEITQDARSNVTCYRPERGWKLLSFGKRHHACFLYRSIEPDRNWVQVTVNILESAGFICWYRDRNLTAGQTYASSIIKSLEQSLKIVVVLSEAFLESPRCKYDLDLALEECLSRDEDGETGILIPVSIERCTIPKILRPLNVLDIQTHKQDWLSLFVRAIENNDKFNSLSYKIHNKSTENEIDDSAIELCQKLHNASMDDIFTFLSKPVAIDLSHFLSQQTDLRFFVSAMNTCGMEIAINKVSFDLRTFSKYVDKPYQIAHCFKQHSHKLSENLETVDLIIHEPEDILCRGNANEMKEFNEVVRSVLKPPEGNLWGVMWQMTGIQTKTIRNECRSLIHDALTENRKVLEVSHPSFLSLSERVKSFSNWPSDKQPTKEELAEAGYFYDVDNNILRCFYCDGVSWDLKPNENPWARHAKWYFNCPHVIASKTEEFIDKCRFEKNNRTDIYNTEYNITETRLSSYDDWPVETCPKPEVMAKAGFYFTHVEDKVVCFHCGYGIRDWKKADDPWYRHAWWSPHCSYLRRYRSANVIDKVLNDRAEFEPLDKCVLTYSIKIRKTR